MSNFIPTIPTTLPTLPGPFENLQIFLELGKAVLTVVSEVGKILLDRPSNENPEIIGLKAEIASKEGVKPENFTSMDEYLNYLNENIPVDDKMISGLSDIEHYKYKVIGAGMYIIGMEQKFNILLPADFWKVAVNVGLAANDIATLITGLVAEKLPDASIFVSYLSGDLQPGSKERSAVRQATEDMLHKKYPDLDIAAIDEKQDELKASLNNN